jgi:hypothetical protein
MFGLFVGALIIKFDIDTGIFATAFIYSCLAMYIEGRARRDEHEVLPVGLIMAQNHISELDGPNPNKVKVIFEDGNETYITLAEFGWLIDGKLNIKEILENHTKISNLN